MQVAQGPDRLAISRVNFYLTLAKAEKCRTPLELFFKRKLGKLKRLFLNVFKYFDPPRVAPCERAWPGLSENV